MIQYEKYSWYVCGDLKVIALLLGLQLGYTKRGIVGTEKIILSKNSGQKGEKHC
jgi:hypothetical protein